MTAVTAGKAVLEVARPEVRKEETSTAVLGFERED